MARSICPASSPIRAKQPLAIGYAVVRVVGLAAVVDLKVTKAAAEAIYGSWTDAMLMKV